MLKFTFLLLLTASAFAGSATEDAPYKNPRLSVDVRVQDLVSRMTLAEKISQMTNDAPGIDRLGVLSYNWWTEALHGAVGYGNSTVFPQAIGLGATWNPDLLHEVSTAISDEIRAKNTEALKHGHRGMHEGLTLWAPNINIFRDPRWGRGQETYGEDPFLTGTMAVQYIKGLQGDDPHYLKAVATPKHFAVHSGPDPERHTFNAIVSEHDLRDTYLPQFEAAIREGHAYSLMGSYNAVNGFPACASPKLLEQILRKEWGFQGFVVSDCGAIGDIYWGHHFAKNLEEAASDGVKAGTDLSCGNEYLQLNGAVKDGLIGEAEINRAVTRLFTGRFLLGEFDPPEMVPFKKIPYSVVESDAHKALALEAARQSIVLLKNQDGVLPLKKTLKRVAVIGPNANNVDVLLGNYNGTPSHAITPLEGVRSHVSAQTEVVYEQGSEIEVPQHEPIPGEFLTPPSGTRGAGLKGEYFANMNLEGKPAFERIDSQVNFDWTNNSPAPGFPQENFSVRWTGTINPQDSGDFLVGATYDDGIRVWVDGKKIIDDWNDHGATTRTQPVHFEAGKSYDVRIEYYQHLLNAVAKLIWTIPESDPGRGMRQRAAQIAKDSDVAILFLGITPNEENEEHDRSTIELPALQEKLLREVQATGTPTIVVYLNGGPVSSVWAEANANAVLDAWYPGQAAGDAIAEVLFGDTNPAGRLPVTIYQATQDLPPMEDYAVQKGRTYRYYQGQPLYAFGYGLSYTTFDYTNLKLSSNTVKVDEDLQVSVDVTNTGSRDGDEVVQVYLKNTSAPEGSPIHYLSAFKRVHIAAKATQTVNFTIAPDRRTYIDPKGIKKLEPGLFLLTVAPHQPGKSAAGSGSQVEAKDVMLTEAFEVK